jgi:hypothetical protein
MREPPIHTTWKITCRSPENAQALQQWLADRIDLDRVLTDPIRIMPGGAEQVQTVPHRLGDYFEDVRVLPDSQGDLVSPGVPDAAGGGAVLERPDGEHVARD